MPLHPATPAASEASAASLTAPAFAAYLRKIDACSDARAWCKDKDFEVAWATCERGDWMMYLLRATGLGNHAAARLACAFAREVLHLNTDRRVSACIETVEDWLNGKANIQQVREARYAAAADAAAADAADAAAAAAAADYAAAAAARLKARARQADIIRELVPMPLIAN